MGKNASCAANATATAAVLLLSSVLPLSLPAMAAQDQWRPNYPSTPLQKVGKGQFRVTAATKNPRLNFLEQVKIRITEADGNPVDNATITVTGRAREVERLMPTNPRVIRNLGGGAYLLGGLRFNMPGSWLLVFDIDTGTKRDKAVLQFQVP